MAARDGRTPACAADTWYIAPEEEPDPPIWHEASNQEHRTQYTYDHNDQLLYSYTHDPQYALTPKRDKKIPEAGYLNSSAYTLDPRGSITATYDAGNLTEQYHYTAYGTLYNYEDLKTQADESDTTIATKRGYNGKVQLAGGQLYNYGYRDYDPNTGVFLTIDPIRDGVNWYAYVGGDPVNFVDPLGLTPLLILEIVAESASITVGVQNIKESIKNRDLVSTGKSVISTAVDIALVAVPGVPGIVSAVGSASSISNNTDDVVRNVQQKNYIGAVQSVVSTASSIVGGTLSKVATVSSYVGNTVKSFFQSKSASSRNSNTKNATNNTKNK